VSRTINVVLLGLSFLLISPLLVKAEEFQRWSALPVLGYSEETKWQYGAIALLFFKPESKGIPGSSLDFSVIGTTRKQLQVMTSPDLYLWHGQIHIDLELVYWNWIAHYFGIGNNPDVDEYLTYDMTRYRLRIPAETKLFLPSSLSFMKYGALAHIEYRDIDFRQKESDLSEPSTTGGWLTGLGYTLSLDTRDHPVLPSHGFYAYWQQVFYNNAFGDSSYIFQELDLRGYTYLFWKTSLALGALYQMTFGDVPFDQLAMPDGTKRFRGVERGVFRDRQAFVWQAELRRPLFWRLAGTIFYETTKVGPYFGALYREKWHHAFGFGGRLALNKKERVFARCDFSLIDGKHLGMSIYIREAF
jgi:hypothetical protein